MLLVFIKEKFSRHGRRGRGVGTRGICELQNQKVISKTLNTSAINVHSPGGAGPATACPSARKQQEDRTTPAEGQLGMGIHLAERTRRKTQQQTRIWYGDIPWFGPYQGTHSIFTLNPAAVLPRLPPAARGRARLARQPGHVPHASKQSSLVRATSLQHPQGRRYGIKSFVKWSIHQGQMEMQTKSKVSNEHLFVMQQAQRNPRSFVAPPVRTSHLSPCPSFLEGKGEDISAFPASATGQQPPESQHRAKRKEMSFSLPQHQLPASPGASHPTPGLIQSTQGLSQTPTGSGSRLWFPPSRSLEPKVWSKRFSTQANSDPNQHPNSGPKHCASVASV